MSIYEMSLDLKKSSPIYSDPIVLRQGDTNVEILVHVFDNSTPKNLENLPIEFHADKPDATTIDDDEQSHFKIGDDKESFTYTVPDELTDASGSTTNTYFKVGSDSTSNFYIHILTKAGMEKIESGDYISKVDRIFNHVMSDYSAINDLAETGKGTFDTALADSKKEIKDLMDNLNAEYVQFINSKTTDFNTFLANLDSQAADVKTKYTALKAQLDALEVPISASAFQSLQTQVNNSAVGTNLLTNTSSSATNRKIELQGSRFDIRGVYSRTDSYEQVIASPDYNEFYYRPMVPLSNKLYGLTPGETYTLSGSASHTSGELKFRGQYGVKNSWVFPETTSDLGIPVSDGTVFTPFSYTFTIPVGATGAYISLQNYDFTAGSLFRFKNIKLEKGSIATDWCPNPSEILTQSDYAKIKAAIVALGGALS